jgi:hypothetical protein
MQMSNKYRYVLALAMVVSLAMMVCASGAEAKTFDTKGSASGTSASVPVDISGNSCTVVNKVEVCTATSGLLTYTGKSSGGPLSGPYTGQGISQTEPVAGTGCSFAPTTIASCTIGTDTAGCKYSFVGGAGANRISSTGDLAAFLISPGGSLCLDGTTLAFEGTLTETSEGGTGKAAGTTGTTTHSFTGQLLISDPAGNGFSWVADTYTGTLTK